MTAHAWRDRPPTPEECAAHYRAHPVLATEDAYEQARWYRWCSPDRDPDERRPVETYYAAGQWWVSGTPLEEALPGRYAPLTRDYKPAPWPEVTL